MPRGANRLSLRSNCDLSYSSGFITESLLVLFLDRSFVFGGSIHSTWWGTVLVVTPNALPSHVSDW